MGVSCKIINLNSTLACFARCEPKPHLATHDTQSKCVYLFIVGLEQILRLSRTTDFGHGSQSSRNQPTIGDFILYCNSVSVDTDAILFLYFHSPKGRTDMI